MANGAAWCHFRGPIYDSDTLSRIFRAGDALVIPGYVGLAVNHAFAHGLPVVTCQSPMHSPEIEPQDANSISQFFLSMCSIRRRDMRVLVRSLCI